MFTATLINFLLFSLCTGSHVAGFIVFIRKALILDIDYPPLEVIESINKTLWNVNIVIYWAETLPVSIKLLPPDPISIHVPSDIAQRSDCHLESLGPLPGTTVGSLHTVHPVDWNRG